MRKFLKSVSIAFIAQIVSLFVSAFMSFFVSKFMSVEAYGYYQLFLFCTTYVGIAQLGISEGNYLENGGKTYDELDKLDLRNQFLSITIVQILVLMIVYFGINRFETNINKHYVYGFALITCITNLWTSFFGLELQAVNKTEKYSLAIIIGKSITLVLFLVAVVMKKDSFQIYSLIYVAGLFISGLIVIYFAREILFAQGKFEFNLFKHKKTIIAGCSLLFSGLISSFIVGINRVYIENYLGIEAFGKVSMALSFCNLLILFSIQIGMVMFPNIMNVSEESKTKIYTLLNIYTPYLTPVIILAYFPIGFVLERWLPDYTESVHWILLFVPYIVYEIKNQIIYYTYLKTMRHEKYMFWVNIISLGLCAIINLIVILTTKNVDYMFIIIDLIMIIKTLSLEIKTSKEINKSLHVINIIDAVICIISTIFMYFKPSVVSIVLCIIMYVALFFIQKRKFGFVRIV